MFLRSFGGLKLTRFARLASLLIPASAFVLLAQGPPPGGFRGGPGFGPMEGLGWGRVEKVVTGAPYSGTFTEQRQQTLPDGNQISTQSETKVYRDSSGRIRTESSRTTPDGQTHTFITLFDPVSGFEARLDPAKLTAVKHTLPAQNGAAPNHPRHNPEQSAAQVTTTDLGTKTIAGLSATGKQVTRTIPAGQVGNTDPIKIVREVWTSTALQIPVQVTVTNPQFGTSNMQLTAVTQSEPDASLFQIPSNYTVTTATGHRGPRPPAGE